jgi:Icc-related predicted phosphoesterase
LKVFVTSDFHGSLDASKATVTKAKKIQPDVIVILGDITHFGSIKDAQKMMTPLIDLGLPLLYVPGNCDPIELTKAEINGAICLHGKCHSEGDASFLGIGGAPKSSFYSWFEMSEAEIMDVLSQGAKQCQQNRWFVIVSHAPPKNTKADTSYIRTHAGSTSLRAFVEEKKPNIVFCGHIHEAKGIDHIDETIIVNPGPVRHGNCAVAQLDDKIEVKLDSL